MEQLEFDFAEYDVCLKRETFHYLDGDYGVEAVISEEMVNGDVDYLVESVLIMDSNERVVPLSEAGITHDDIIREYEIDKEMENEAGMWDE